jgi:hypothetical protein
MCLKAGIWHGKIFIFAGNHSWKKETNHRRVDIQDIPDFLRKNSITVENTMKTARELIKR